MSQNTRTNRTPYGEEGYGPYFTLGEALYNLDQTIYHWYGEGYSDETIADMVTRQWGLDTLDRMGVTISKGVVYLPPYVRY